MKKQLRRVEDDMKRSQTDSSKYYAVLKEIDARVHAVVTAPPEENQEKEIPPATASNSTTPPTTVNGNSTEATAEKE